MRLSYTFTKPAKGFKAGSLWEQTLVFQPGVRYVLCGEQITSVNDVDDLFYRIDMPGHISHKSGDTFTQVYLSYHDKPIPASAFAEDFAPDAKFLYQRKDGQGPERMIRAYQVKVDGKPGPWLAGMTLDPAAVVGGVVPPARLRLFHPGTAWPQGQGRRNLRGRLRRRLVRRRRGDGGGLRPLQGRGTLASRTVSGRWNEAVAAVNVS